MKTRGAPLLALGMIAGCFQSHYNLATQQQDYTITSDQREVNMGRKIARKVEEEVPPVADAALQDRINAIGQRLAAVCDRKALLYRFAVLEGDDVNAFSLPGGYVFLYNELVKKAANDDEVAGVLAHEIAHIAARHAVHRYESGIGAQILQLASLAAREPAASGGMSIAMQAAMLAYAREDELQADRLAVQYLKAAGFKPEGMLTFLRTIQEIHKQEAVYLPRGLVKPNYAVTHPGIPERVASVKEALYGVADYIDYLNVPE